MPGGPASGHFFRLQRDVVQRKNSIFGSRNQRKLAGAAEIGPLMAKTATSNWSPGATARLSTRRYGMLKLWIVPGLVLSLFNVASVPSAPHVFTLSN